MPYLLVKQLRFKIEPPTPLTVEPEKTCEHDHPDMVVMPLAGFRRRQRMGGEQVVEFEKAAFDIAWADAMTHARGEHL